MRYKYIHIEETESKPKTKVYTIYNIKTGNVLGEILWDCGWRRYIVTYVENCKFDLFCTLDIADFLKRLDKKY
jgi:hypothetical protein